MKGQEFRELRLRLGMTQERLAERMEVKRETVNRWERGVRPVPEIAALAITQLIARARRTKTTG